MCTGVEWVWCCRLCGTVLLKDRGSVKGYTCREATRNRIRGVCRTGVEWRHYDKLGAEVCALCEIKGELEGLTAETCDEAALTPPEVIFDNEDEDEEDGGALLYQGR
ncbi:hypothetical protein F5X99DRAFT_408113 [Biscogniauxia marginata]|nr:hypothetical protein F5X99DRAFT_408113 [Biscogniauxia marginata]